MFAIKGIWNITTGSLNYVSNQILGLNNNDGDNLRTNIGDANLYEPIESSSAFSMNNNANSSSVGAFDTEQPSNRTTRILQETSPLLHGPQSSSSSSPTTGESFTSSYYIIPERSYKIIILFLLHAIVYYTIAVIGFSYLVESWSIIDSLYYATVLFCTIGFGDIEPDNWKGQLYTILLAIYGIAFLGILLGSVIDYCLEYHHVQHQQNQRNIGTQVLHQLTVKQQDNAIMKQPMDHLPAVPQQQHQQQQQRKGDTTIIDETIVTTESKNKTLPSIWDEILKLILFEIPVVTFAIGIAIVIGHYEGWTIFESIYWFVISGATVGFGDYYPKGTYVKLFCVFYLPFAVAVIGDLLGRIVTIYMDRQRQIVELEFMQRSLSLVDLDVMDVDQNGRVDKVEFLSYMLCALQKVSKEDINDILDLFQRLDVDKTNFLTKDDLIHKEWETSFRNSIEQSIQRKHHRKQQQQPQSSSTSNTVYSE